MKVVILAGGLGTRLAPYTTVFPKPLMPLGEKPILETILCQLEKSGFKEVTLAVGYLSELLMAYFNDGERLGVNIRYSKEDKPLGTAGPLSLIDDITDTFLVMNGDILTTLAFQKLINFHKDKKAVATVAVSNREIGIDYGVINFNESGTISDYIEKPTLNYSVSMGIYVFEPSVLTYIPKNKKMDFPDLIKELISIGKKVSAYQSEDYWLDIGRHDDYEKALEEFNTMKDKLLNSEQ